MSFSPQQMRNALVEYGLCLRYVPAARGWVAETPGGGRTHRGTRPTPEEAVESAVFEWAPTTEAADRARRAQLFDLINTGELSVEKVEVDMTYPDVGVVIERRYRVVDRNARVLVDPTTEHGRSIRAALERAVQSSERKDNGSRQ